MGQNLLGTNVSVAGAAAVVTLAAVADRRYCITGISFSHSIQPVAPVLVTIDTLLADGTTHETQSLYLTSPGVAPLPIPGGYYSPCVNKDVVITVAGDGTSIATLNVYGTKER